MYDLKFQMHNLKFRCSSGANYVRVQTQYLQPMEGINVKSVIWSSNVKYDPKYTFYMLHLKSEISSSHGLEVLNFRSKGHHLCCVFTSVYTCTGQGSTWF